MNKELLHRIILVISFTALASVAAFAQKDSTAKDTMRRGVPVDSLPKVATPISHQSKIDSVLKYHSPKKAAIRSAILPGLGQIYNKKYWKLPIVYGALGISGSVFVYNLTTYRDLRDAYRVRYKASQGDTSGLSSINPLYKTTDINALRNYRDDFRRRIDYSALVFILLWGLNVVDATVDAHLKSFDVSPDLSLQFKFGPSQMAGTTGVSLVLAFK
ncbi:MAG TPA: DUF5683 domain-containing protein [Flavisolibacter sp.]|nr:DUF5683 domain-containing protein [Flavisolibacter sp.]